MIYPTFKSTKWTFMNLQIYQLHHKNALGGARKMTAEGAFLKLVKEFLPFSLHFLPKTPLFLRLAEELDDVADGLGREELGILALVAAGEGVHQRRTALDPLREVVGGHMRIAIGEIQLSQFALGVTLDRHNSLVFSA